MRCAFGGRLPNCSLCVPKCSIFRRALQLRHQKTHHKMCCTQGTLYENVFDRVGLNVEKGSEFKVASGSQHMFLVLAPHLRCTQSGRNWQSDPYNSFCFVRVPAQTAPRIAAGSLSVVLDACINFGSEMRATSSFLDFLAPSLLADCINRCRLLTAPTPLPPSPTQAFRHKLGTSLRACVHDCTHACMHACMQQCMQPYVHSCMHACTHARAHARTHARAHAHRHAFMRACMHACIHARMHACMNACMHTYLFA